MKKIIFLILLISFSFGGFINGNRLYQWGLEYFKKSIGQNWEPVSDGFYMGYVDGVFDAYYNTFSFCPPKNIRADQVFDIVFKYLQSHPEKRNLPAHILVEKALKEVWPCK